MNGIENLVKATVKKRNKKEIDYTGQGVKVRKKRPWERN